MRRVILAIVITAVALVLLLTFKTHTQAVAPTGAPASAVGSPAPGTTSPKNPGNGRAAGKPDREPTPASAKLSARPSRPRSTEPPLPPRSSTSPLADGAGEGRVFTCAKV